MKILLVEPWGRREGHPATYPRFLAQALVNFGVDVTLITFDGLLDETKELKLKHVSFLPRRTTRPLRFFISYYRRYSPFQYFIAIAECLATFFITSVLARNKQDVVIHILDSDPYSRLLSFAFLFRRQSLVIGLPYHFSVSNSFRDKIRAKITRYGFEMGAKTNNIFFVCETWEAGESYSNHFPEIFQERLTCIPWGTVESKRKRKEEARKQLGLPLRGTIFLTFGTTHPGKCFKTIFQAVKDLPHKFFILHAGLITEKNNNPKRLADKYGWSDYTFVENRYIPEKEMVNYFSAADAVILSYKRNFLTSSGVLSHACQFLVPVIASDVGQVGKFVRTYKLGLTFVPENYYSLRKTILRFLSYSRKKKHQFVKNIKNFISLFSWEKIAERYIFVYRKVLKSQTRYLK